MTGSLIGGGGGGGGGTVEDRLETGLLNLWYLVADATEIGNRPVGLKRLNRDVVAWRDANGAVNVVEDRCPHRGARLSRGRIIDGQIACAYHGLQLDGDGVITADLDRDRLAQVRADMPALDHRRL